MNNSKVIQDVQKALGAFDDPTRDHIAHALWMDEFSMDEISPDILSRLVDAKNSPAAYGDRMRRYISYLMDPSALANTRLPQDLQASASLL